MNLARRPGWGGGSLRAFRRAVLFALFAWWLVGLLSLRLSVCAFDRGCVLRTFQELVLAASWAPFLRLWDSSGAFGAPWGPPLAAQGAQSQISPLCSLSFWAYFGSILEVKIDKKSDVIFN